MLGKLCSVLCIVLSTNTFASVLQREYFSQPAIRRFTYNAVSTYGFCGILLTSKRSTSTGSVSRYMSFPKAPSWLLSKTQSHSENVTPIAKDWTQHYNPVDDVFYYRSPCAVIADTGTEEVHVSNTNQMVRVRDKGTSFVKNTLPFCATGRVKSEFITPGGYNVIGIGTAFVVDYLVVLTVAHNFLPQSLDGSRNALKQMARRVSFEWQYDNPSNGLSINVDRYKVHPRWHQSFNPEFDFALVLLEKPVDEVINHAKTRIVSSDSIANSNLTVVGYPAKMPGIPAELQGEVMYESSGTVLSCCGKQLHYDANTYNGNSGGPILLESYKDDVIGLHTRGDSRAMRNSGIMLRPDLEEFMCNTLREFYSPNSFEAEVDELLLTEYKGLLIGSKEKAVIAKMHTIEQVKEFLGYLRTK